METPLVRKRWLLTPELAVLLGLAFFLRLWVYFFVPNIHWPDEIYQTMEPAHRLVFGSGVISWEWAVGIRSWLLPGVYAGLMEIGRLFGSDPAIINLPIALFMAAIACAPIACAYFWGRKFFGRSGGIIAGAVNAFWVDLIYMSPHALTEVVAADTLIVALYLGVTARSEGTDLRRRLFLSGFMLGLTFALRFHLGPALAVAALWICGIDSWPRWRTLLAGASLPVLALGLLDWATLGMPFQSISLNFWLNMVVNISAGWGTEPFATFLLLPFYIWGSAAGLVLFMAILGARRLPILLLVFALIFLTHSFVPHKEYRFIFPALPLLFTLVGIGTAELVPVLRNRWPKARYLPYGLTAILVIGWSAVSFTVAQSSAFNSPWTRARAHLEAFRYIAQNMPETCGVALYGIPWPVTPGQTWLPPQVPLYQTNPIAFERDSAGFTVVLQREFAIPDDRYVRVACFDGDEDADGHWLIHLCLWKRPAGCEAGVASAPFINWPAYFRHRGRFFRKPPADKTGDHDD